MQPSSLLYPSMMDLSNAWRHFLLFSFSCLASLHCSYSVSFYISLLAHKCFPRHQNHGISFAFLLPPLA